MKMLIDFLANLMPMLKSEKGQTVIEYILVIVLVSLVLILLFLGGGVQEGVSTGANTIGNALSTQ